MRMAIFAWALVGALPVATRVSAEPCREVGPAVAERARAILAPRPDVLRFCEPCGDLAPGVPTKPGAVAIAPGRAGAHRLSVDGVVLDLASTYVQTEATRYDNLAILAGCPTAGRSPSLAVVGETQTGVLIAADAPAWSITADRAPIIAAPALLADGPAPSGSRGDWWLALVAASTVGFATAWLGLLGLARLRRRHGHVPRAADLPLPGR